MRRVVSVWFPHWPTDRLRRRRSAEQPEAGPGPVVTALHDGRRRVVAAADPVAAGLGLRPGMAIAQALAIVPDLHVAEAEPDADAAALERLARWCHRVTPLAAVDGDDGLWLDITGCAALSGGEQPLLDGLLARFARDSLHARAAVADTPGAAHAAARHAGASPAIIPPGEQATALAALPVGALRLPPELDATLRRLGFEQVRHLARIPRAMLGRRFGPLPSLRLDQAHGRVHEPLRPIAPAHALWRRLAFIEPLLTAEALGTAITHLVQPLCEEMEHTGLGARQLDLLFERVDNQVAAIRVGTARPSRDARHLARMLADRLDTVDPGMGVEAMRLVVALSEPLQWEQQESDGGLQDVSRLVDRLANRLGAERLFQAAPRPSEFPERSVEHRPPGPAPASAGMPESPGSTGKPYPAPPAATKRHGGIALVGPGQPAPSPLQATIGDASAATPGGVNLVAEGGTDPEGEAWPPSQAQCHAAASMVPRTKPKWPILEACADVAAGMAPGSPARCGTSPALRPALHLVRPEPAAMEAPSPRLEWRRPWPLRRMPPRLAMSPRLEMSPRLGLPQSPALPTSSWPARLQAPPRLLHPPRPIQALAALPDQPPVAFTWRNRRHKVRRADGPERVHGEWWSHATEVLTVRDYFQVEDETGQRFWLFRQGNGIDPRSGDLSWFLHGLF